MQTEPAWFSLPVCILYFPTLQLIENNELVYYRYILQNSSVYKFGNILARFHVCMCVCVSSVSVRVHVFYSCRKFFCPFFPSIFKFDIYSTLFAAVGLRALRFCFVRS